MSESGNELYITKHGTVSMTRLPMHVSRTDVMWLQLLRVHIRPNYYIELATSHVHVVMNKATEMCCPNHVIFSPVYTLDRRFPLSINPYQSIVLRRMSLT